jgi:hypothetical protein
LGIERSSATRLDLAQTRDARCRPMLIVRASRKDWKDGLVTGAAIRPAFDAWFGTGICKDRTQ